MNWAVLMSLQQSLKSIMDSEALKGMAAPTRNAFTQPGSNVAHLSAQVSWWSFWMVIPFILIAYIGLVYIMIRFRDKGDGRQAADFHEHNFLEFCWTVIPLIIVVVVAVHSYGPLHFMEFGGNHPDVTINVVGHQFFWEFKYPQYGIDLSNATLVLPANKVVDLDLTSVDVIHGFFVPGLGIQEDALPGRITNLWFKAQPGYYKGQCDQLCGQGHSGMLIEVQILPDKEFQQWLATHRSQPAPAKKTKAAAASAMLRLPGRTAVRGEVGQ
ncbi:MAG: cytochrome c oxidase subunit II [Terriglobales bacterium]